MKVKSSKILKVTLIISLSVILVLSAIALAGYFYFQNRIYPGVYVDGISLGNLTPDQANLVLVQSLQSKASSNLNFTYNGATYNLDLSSFEQSVKTQAVVDQAYALGHSRFFLPKANFNLISLSTPDLDSQIKNISNSINKNPLESQLQVNGEDITVTPSSDGLILDEDSLKSQIISYLNNSGGAPQSLPIKVAHPKLSYSQALSLKNDLDKVKLNPIKLTFKNSGNSSDIGIDPTYLSLSDILNLIDLSSTTSTLASANIFGTNWSVEEASAGDTDLSDVHLKLDQTKLEAYLKNLSGNINQDVKEPLFNFDASANGGKGKVTEFSPPTEGRSLNIPESEAAINNSLDNEDFSSVALSVDTVEPKNKLVNDLGVKELLGEGVSHFYHSIPNRIYNLELAASKVNGTLVPPGETFSFDQTVGDISAASGYKQGYVIESGRTVLDDGGGVCQDSTTLFRAVLNAGLPVVARTAHAYRVGYYEQGFPPGLDATTFYPSVDFKFKNDTPGYILIQVRADDATETLYYDLYGTSDGRVSQVTTPVILSQTPPLPDVHQEDPTLPKGTEKQVDFSAWGANVVFSRTVTRNGQTIINDTYHSNYQPWANVYLDGTGG